MPARTPKRPLRPKRPKKGSGAGPVLGAPKPVTQPQFAEPQATPDPQAFLVRHASDSAAYKILDTTPNLPPLPFEPPRGLPEPVMRLENALGKDGSATVDKIKKNGQSFFTPWAIPEIRAARIPNRWLPTRW